MTDLTPDKLDQIEKAASAARQRPWTADTTAGATSIWSGSDWVGETMLDEDAEYIATMDPATTRALVARFRELEARIAEARKAHWRIEGDGRAPICEGCFEYWPCATIQALGEDA